MITNVPNAKNKRLRARVFDRDQNMCRYCGVLTNTIEGSRYQRTIDHYIPQVLGGPNSIDNCVCACYGCNNQKSEDDPRVTDPEILEKYGVRNLWQLIPVPDLPPDRMLMLSEYETHTLVQWATDNKSISSVKTVIDADDVKVSYLRIAEENYKALGELARLRSNHCCKDVKKWQGTNTTVNSASTGSSNRSAAVPRTRKLP
jgi:5-methylcytosine-specific restriction endonuclease McrA